MVFLLLAAVPVWAPLVATGRLRIAAATAGVLIAPLLAAVLLGSGALPALGAGVAAAGFFLLMAGIALAAARLLRRPAAGAALAGLMGIGLLASFHLGDPWIEWFGSGQGSTVALSILHAANPASGAVGHALDVDWLRLPIMYSGFPGSTADGLSTAQYYLWHYFPWWGSALLHGTLGLILLAGTFRGQPLRWAAE